MNKILYLFIFSFLVSFDLIADNENLNKIHNEIRVLKKKYNSHMNETYIDISVIQNSDSLQLQGFVSDSLIYKDIMTFANKQTFYTGCSNLNVLPNTYQSGVINVSVADLHVGPGFTKSLATQELLGTIVKIWFNKDGWSLIQCPNRYYGWISNRQIIELSKEDLKQWNDENTVVFTALYGSSYENTNVDSPKIVSDLVTNNRLALIGEEGNFYKIKYPDNRIAFVKKSDTKKYSNRIEDIDIQEVMNTVFSLRGIPYVWGGISSKGVDCSGLVSSAFRSNGYFTYRDASQQALVGESIEITPDYSKLEYGDLMFFGTGIDHIRHVGFYIGNRKFIHASGFVRISSMDKNDIDYDETNTKEFVLAKRYINNKTNSAITKINF